MGLGRLFRDHWGPFTVAGVFTFCSAALMLAFPFYIINLYQRILPNEAYSSLFFLTGGVIAAFLIMGALDAVRSAVFSRVGEGIDANISQRIFAALHRSRTGEREHLQDVGKVREFLTGQQVEAFFELPFTPIFLAVLFLMHPLLGALGLTGALVLMGLGAAQHVFSVRAHAEGERERRRDNAFARATVRNLPVMQALGMRRSLRERWQQIHARAVDAQMRSNDVIMGLTAWSMPVRFLFQIVVLGTGAWLVIQGELQAGVMIAANILTMRAMQPAMKAMSSWRGFLDARDAYARLAAYLDVAEPGAGRRGATRPDPEQPAVSARDLTVHLAEAGQPVVDRVALSVARGELVGVTGPNGAGKSSLARAILGIWPASSGAVALAGIPLEAVSDDDRRDLIGYVPQDVALFDGTIAENIRRFGPKDDDGVVAAAKRAGVHGIVLRLPDGYDTRVAATEGALTGGQRQRIAVARALYGDPAVIVLDEPNANLDSNGEEAMLDALRTARDAGAGVLMITHAPGLLRQADRVLRLEHGRVVDAGAPEQVLVARPAPAAGAGGSAHPRPPRRMNTR